MISILIDSDGPLHFHLFIKQTLLFPPASYKGLPWRPALTRCYTIEANKRMPTSFFISVSQLTVLLDVFIRGGKERASKGGGKEKGPGGRGRRGA